MLSFLRKMFTGEMGLVSAIALAVIVANVGVNIWQRWTINDLKDWRGGVLEELSQAVDQRGKSGDLLPVTAKDARAHIAALGRFRADTRNAQARARAEDSQHVLSVERQDAAITRKAGDDYDARIAQARADADALRTRLADADERLRIAQRASGNGEGGSRAPPVPGLSVARPEADEAPGADRLSPCACNPPITGPMTIAERQLATEQAIQLDELITTIENFAKVGRAE